MPIFLSSDKTVNQLIHLLSIPMQVSMQPPWPVAHHLDEGVMNCHCSGCGPHILLAVTVFGFIIGSIACGCCIGSCFVGSYLSSLSCHRGQIGNCDNDDAKKAAKIGHDDAESNVDVDAKKAAKICHDDTEHFDDAESPNDDNDNGDDIFKAKFDDANVAGIGSTGGSGSTEHDLPEMQCPRCSRNMRFKPARKANFFGCECYPACRGSRPLSDQKKFR